MGSKISLARCSTIAAAVLASGAIAACGSSGNDDSSSGSNAKAPTVKKDPAVAKLVPASVKSKGTLTVAADATYPPNEFLKPGSKTVVGMDADLAKALGTVMGLKLTMKNAPFDGIIPGLASHKYDIGMSSFTDNKEREATVDFVTYFSAGTSFYTKAQGGAAINSLSEICGHKLAIEKGTVQVDDATAQNKKCKSAGKPAAKVQVYPDQNGANLAISSGRAEVGLADSPVAAYIVKKSGGQFKLIGKPYGTAPYGIAIPKNSGLDKPILAGVKALMSNGAYGAILKKWGIQAGAIDNPTINGATS
jgi:polar amino acid transport system substrate-binding protein